MKSKTFSLSALLLLLFITALANDKPKPESEAGNNNKEKELATKIKNLESSLKYERGEIKLKDGLAKLKIPEGYRYLNPEDAEKVLVEGWGNPPSSKTLGMLFRSDVSPFGDDTWGVVITYQEDGYVKDDEASSINYTDLLKDMKESTVEENEERQKAGYEKVELVGWAEPPHYDKANHKLYWAQELKFGDETNHTLNYDVRVLGRRGVLSLNAVASTSQLQSIQEDMQSVMSFVEFNEGNRYSDFTPGVDKVAAFGIGALIAGKLAAKAGFFKLLLPALLAAKKFIVLGIIALGVLIRKLFGGKKKEDEDTNSIT